MAERYAVSAGNWVAARFDGGTLPGVGDTVHANGFAVTIDTSITVDALSTRAGAVAVAGGSFTTSGTVTVNADSYGGSTSCLNLAANSGAIQNGNSYGSITTNGARGTVLNYLTTQNGDAYGQNGSFRSGTNNISGVLNGDSYGGSAASAYGAVLNNGAVQNGNSYGDAESGTYVRSNSTLNGDCIAGNTGLSYGCTVDTNGFVNGDSYGGANNNCRGLLLTLGVQNGNSYGGGNTNAHGTDVLSGSIQFGQQFGGTNATAYGTGISGGLAVTTGITDDTAPALIARSNDSSVILQNGTTAGQVTIASGILRTQIGETLTNYPFIVEGGMSGFTGIRGTSRRLGT